MKVQSVKGHPFVCIVEIHFNVPDKKIMTIAIIIKIKSTSTELRGVRFAGIADQD